MPRYVAFLRAINVGGHTVRMERLRKMFVELGFSNVETFIASGNVVFESRSSNTAALERQIGQALGGALGYEVATFVRTVPELAAVARHTPFPKADPATIGALNVAFLASPFDSKFAAKMQTLRTDIDDFHLNGRELYWLCRTRQSESTFSNVVFERATGVKATFRGLNTIRKMAAKYCEPSS